MIIAVTADCHLTTRAQHPERYRALEILLDRLVEKKVGHLIVAGDLFDENVTQFADFEALAAQKAYRAIHWHVIPGNHDARLSARALHAENVTVYDAPTVAALDLMSLPIFFLPYREASNMGAHIGSQAQALEGSRWVLVGHGDWIEGLREPNPYEPGVYMPLTRADLEQFSPVTAVLGHIHKPQESGRVVYPGSPYPLHINETGRRRVLLLDSETGRYRSEPLFTDPLYFHAEITALPLIDEKAFIDAQIVDFLAQWRLSDQEKTAAVVRVRVRGYTADRAAVGAWVRQGFDGLTLDGEAGPDLGQLRLAENRDLAEIARRVHDEVQSLPWPQDEDEPSREEILLEALKVIYEE